MTGVADDTRAELSLPHSPRSSGAILKTALVATARTITAGSSNALANARSATPAFSPSFSSTSAAGNRRKAFVLRSAGTGA